MGHKWLKWVLFFTSAGAVCYFLYAVTADHMVKTAALLEHLPATIVIDPGHGGEDGGAVSLTGQPESRFNLEIGQKLDQLLRFCGIRTCLTRQEDISLHTGDCKTIAEKKRSDLKNRVTMVNAIPGAVLVSIHQNHFSDPQYSGAQVFYARTDGSQSLAEQSQDLLRTVLAPSNHRDCYPSESVYLMQKILCPGILVECGFLSHPQEEQQLQEPAYQIKIACALGGAITQFLQERDQYGQV